jgi:hypothetical protein
MIIKDTESVDIHTSTGPMRTYLFRPVTEERYPGLLLYSEIFQVTGPIRRAAASRPMPARTNLNGGLATGGKSLLSVVESKIFHVLQPKQDRT